MSTEAVDPAYEYGATVIELEDANYEIVLSYS